MRGLLKKEVSREDLLAAIREAAPSVDPECDLRKRFLPRREFLKKSGLHRHDIYRHFKSWNEALAAAGAGVVTHQAFVEAGELLRDWGTVARKLQRLPPCSHYNVLGKYCVRTLALRFGRWSNVRDAFLKFAKGKKEWIDVVKLCQTTRQESRGSSRGEKPPVRADAAVIIANSKLHEDRPVYGEPMGPPGLINAPTNESGVILVFGLLAAQLGFHIQTVRTAFPDCTALRKMGDAGWQNVTIEFEFKSSNFHLHGHPPNGCDLIVCWAHDWQDCPPNLEVIALRDVIGQCGRAALN